VAISESMPPQDDRSSRKIAVRFVLLIGVLSFFADFTYEGSRSVLGPYLQALGASAAVVGVVTGFGELVGYGLRLVSGRWADATGRFWPIAILGYVVQMAAVPALALTHSWQAAATLIILERVGKATRNPPRDVMLSHAAKQIGGYGLVFGIHEALDQFGAMLGPLLVALILANRGSYHEAFAVLLVPALINLAFVATARLLYPRPQDLESSPPEIGASGLPPVFWLYLAGAALVAAGFADYPLIAYHFGKTHSVPSEWIAVFYSVAMGCQRNRVASVWSPIRSLRFLRPGRAHRCCRALRTPRLPRRLLAGIDWRGDLGNGDRRARIHHPGGGCAHGPGSA
jgi:hypothetical protein